MKNLKMRGGASPRKMGRVGDRLCCASPIFFHLTPTEAMVVWCVRFWWWWCQGRQGGGVGEGGVRSAPGWGSGGLMFACLPAWLGLAQTGKARGDQRLGNSAVWAGLAMVVMGDSDPKGVGNLVSESGENSATHFTAQMTLDQRLMCWPLKREGETMPAAAGSIHGRHHPAGRHSGAGRESTTPNQTKTKSNNNGTTDRPFYTRQHMT